MKLLFFTDTHIRPSNPRNRLDNFYESVLKKLEEIRDYANSHDIDYVIHGGDIFDRPDCPIKATSQVGLILASFKMPIYIVVGNHDIFGYNLDTLDRSMLGLLTSFGILKLIDKDGELLEKKGQRVLLLGKNFSADLDTSKDNYILKDSDIKYQADKIINVVHGFLTDRPFIKYVDHTLVGEIVDTKADLTLSGHYHTGFPIQKIDGKIFANPGSIVRITNSLAEIKRRPKFLEIEVTKDDVEVREIYLKSAKAGEEVLDRSKLIEDQYKDQRLMLFADSIDQSIDLDLIDLDAIIDSIAGAEDFDQEIKSQAKIRIEKAKEIINADN
ncbi:metallophosphoesterase family protein [Neofamilia massiliensis]|uniref:metallophosphoesterase family protein n=1 Tax=Neofamilia massiliensis TaxID=1673724 RepID=UPI0006BB8B0E|nr:metallophosphoesterase [Neofamilia massiliensis]